MPPEQERPRLPQPSTSLESENIPQLLAWLEAEFQWKICELEYWNDKPGDQYRFSVPVIPVFNRFPQEGVHPLLFFFKTLKDTNIRRVNKTETVNEGETLRFEAWDNTSISLVINPEKRSVTVTYRNTFHEYSRPLGLFRRSPERDIPYTLGWTLTVIEPTNR